MFSEKGNLRASPFDGSFDVALPAHWCIMGGASSHPQQGRIQCHRPSAIDTFSELRLY
jgi:hypothetical protein